MAMMPPAPANERGWIDGVFNVADGLLNRWMDYERFDAETDALKAATRQNINARGQSVQAVAPGGVSLNNWLMIGGAVLLGLVVLKRI